MLVCSYVDLSTGSSKVGGIVDRIWIIALRRLWFGFTSCTSKFGGKRCLKQNAKPAQKMMKNIQKLSRFCLPCHPNCSLLDVDFGLFCGS